jgi:hypothetical protein
MSKIVAELEVRDSNVAKAAKGVRSKIEKEMSPLRRLNIGAGLARGMAILGGASIAAGAAILAGTKAALDFGGQMSDLSARTGIAAGELMVLGQAFKNGGMSVEAVGPAVNRLQKALAGVNEDGDDTAGIFGQLGLRMEELQRMAPDAQFRTVGAAIAKLSSPTERTAAAMKIFGRSGAELMAVFNSPDAFGTAAREVGAQAEILNRNAELFDQVSNKLENAGLKTQGFFLGVADRVAPILVPLLDRFEKMDLAAQGQAFGDSMSVVLDEWTRQNPGKTLAEWTLYAAQTYSNVLIDGVSEGIKLLSTVPGFGGFGQIELKKYDTSWRQDQIAESANRLQSIRDSFRAQQKPAEGMAAALAQDGASAAGAGTRPSVSRMFSTTMGLFTKDPLAAENRRQTALLEKIERNTSGKGRTDRGARPANGPLAFS